MKLLTLTAAVLLSIPGAGSAVAQPYTARRDADVVRLQDAKSRTTVSVIVRLPDDQSPLGARGSQSGCECGMDHEPAGVLQAAGVDEPVSVRSHDRHDVSASERCARSDHHDTQPVRRGDAGGRGFHPYFQLTDSPRDEWTVSIGARTRWLLAPTKVPTGVTQPIEQFFPNPQSIALKDYDLDDVFADLIRDSSGRAVMAVRGKTQKLEVLLGPRWRSAVVWAPKPAQPGQDRNFICFEPMAGVTNAMNLSQKGLYRELQSIAPGESWRESFWIRPSGF